MCHLINEGRHHFFSFLLAVNSTVASLEEKTVEEKHTTQQMEKKARGCSQFNPTAWKPSVCRNCFQLKSAHSCELNCKSTPIFPHTYIHTYIHTYMNTYIHTYTHTYIHTYIHTSVHHIIIHGIGRCWR